MKAEPEYVNMQLVRFRSTGILTDSAQKLPAGHCTREEYVCVWTNDRGDFWTRFG
jgi:hypothetical protein